MPEPKISPSLDHFIDVTTGSARNVHFAEKDWPGRTLCGHTAHWPPPTATNAKTCGQCLKSRTRRIEGRSS